MSPSQVPALFYGGHMRAVVAAPTVQHVDLREVVKRLTKGKAWQGREGDKDKRVLAHNPSLSKAAAMGSHVSARLCNLGACVGAIGFTS